MSNASRISASDTSWAPASTMRIASSVPATTRSSGLSGIHSSSGLTMKPPSSSCPIRTEPTGSGNGMSETMSAALAPFMASTSYGLTWSTDIGIATSCVSRRQPFGKKLRGRLAAGPVQPFEQSGGRNACVRIPVDEQRRGRHDARADPGAEVAIHALRDRVRASVRLETVEVEPEAPRALPQMRVIEASVVRVERVVKLPVRLLESRGLGGVREDARPRVLGHDREVAEGVPDPKPGQEPVRLRAVRAFVVRVLDDDGTLPADMILRPKRRRARRGELGWPPRPLRGPRGRRRSGSR